MKFLLDECVARRAAAAVGAVLALSATPHEIVHMRDFAGAGALDEDWARRAARERWFVITKDSGQRGLGPPLQIILPALGVSAAYFHRKLGQHSALQQARAIIAALPALERAAAAPAGTRLRIVVQGDGFTMRPWPLNKMEYDAMRLYRRSDPGEPSA